jgi:hypothetical protein
VATGAVGLAAFAGGSLLMALPPIDAPDDEVVATLELRRQPVLAGAVASVLGVALLLAPLAEVGGAFALATWVLGFAFLALGACAPAAVAWRDPDGLPPAAVRLVLDLAHLATWSLSAPVGAVSTVATTAGAVDHDIATGPLAVLLVALAAAKVGTVLVELAGTHRRSGWNAGGWALGSSGYVTVAWFAALLLALA